MGYDLAERMNTVVDEVREKDELDCDVSSGNESENQGAVAERVEMLSIQSNRGVGTFSQRFVDEQRLKGVNHAKIARREAFRAKPKTWCNPKGDAHHLRDDLIKMQDIQDKIKELERSNTQIRATIRSK